MSPLSAQIDYDSVIIGSGAGGLAAAVALAQAGHRVLVVEQHYVPGGWLHSFVLSGYRFNTGVHYIGELGPGERLRRVYEGLGVSRDLEFLELNPDGYDHVLIGDESFDIPKGRRAYVERLKARFPAEARGIDRLFRRIGEIYDAFQCIVDAEWGGLLGRPAALPWFFRSGGSLINSHVRDPRLRAVLLAQSGNHAMPPSRVSASVHASMMHHYFEGAYHPRGGGIAIARAFVRALERAGGEIRLSTSVERILIEKGRAWGVQLADGQVVRAANIVSNADPETTFGRLIGRDSLGRRLRRRIDRLSASTSCLSLYLAVDADLESMGMDSGNYWIYQGHDLEQFYREGLGDYAVRHPPRALFLTATTLKEPRRLRDGHHQLEAFTFVSYDAFARWRDEPTGMRSTDYQDLKASITDNMLRVIEQRFPGIRKAVAYSALGTPLTNAHYLRAHRGCMYGTAKSVRQVGPFGLRARTRFQNLYLCGASTLAHGVAYSTITGLMAAGQILHCRLSEMLRQPGPALTVRAPAAVQEMLERSADAATSASEP